jgi:hypothetical protein
VIVVAVAIVVCGLALTFVRRVARRELAPIPVLVTGDVPPAPQWLPLALRESAPAAADSWAWSTVEESGVLTGFRGKVTLPGENVVLTTALQPHTHPATFSTSRPLRVLVDLAEFPRRPGLARLLFGAYPTTSAVRLRTALQRRIADQARAVGAQARPARRLAATTAALGALAVVIALTALVGPQLEQWVAGPGPQSTAPAARATAPPASATACPAAGKPTKPPTRSASGNKQTGCALAEAVRRTYLKRAAGGRPVTLPQVTRPKSKQKYDLTCKGSPLVTCTSGKVLVYLY